MPIESAPSAHTYHKLPELSSKPAADSFKRQLGERVSELPADDPVRKEISEKLASSGVGKKDTFTESDLDAIKEIIRALDPTARFKDETGTSGEDAGETGATALTPPKRSDAKATAPTGRTRGVPKATPATSAGGDTTAASTPAAKTTSKTSGISGEKITFDEQEVSVENLRGAIVNLEEKLDERIVALGFTARQLTEKDGPRRSDAYASLQAYIRNLKGSLTKLENGEDVSAEKLQEIADKLREKLVAFRNEIAPRVKNVGYQEITEPVGEREIKPGTRGVAIVNGVKRPAAFVERTQSGRIEVSLEDEDEANNDVVVGADQFQVFASQERLALKKEWRALREKRMEAEQNHAWWKAGRWGKRSKVAKAEEAAHQKYVQALLPEMHKREQRNQEDGEVVGNLQKRLPELQARFEALQTEPDSPEKTKELAQLERRIKNVERFNAKPEQFYRLWAINQFIRGKKQEDNAMRKEWLSKKQKETLVSVSEHLKRNKWRYRSLVVGGVVIGTGGVAFFAGAGIAAALGVGAGAGAFQTGRMAAGIGGATAVGGAMYAGETLNVKRQERMTSRVEADTANTSFDRLMTDFASVNAEYVTAFDDLEKAHRARMRNTAIAAGTAGFVAGGAAGIGIEGIDNLIDNLEFQLTSNNPLDVNSVDQTATITAPDVTSATVTPPGEDATVAYTPEAPDLPQPAQTDQAFVQPESQAAQPIDETEDVDISETPNLAQPEPPGQVDVQTEPPASAPEMMSNDPQQPGAPAVPESVGDIGTLDSDGFQDRAPGGEIPSLVEANATAEAPPVAENLVSNPEQMVTIPESGRIDTLSESFYQKYCDGELVGLPEDMSRAEFESKMWKAFHDLDNNESVMERMNLPNRLSEVGDVDKVMPGQTINVTPLIEHMNGASVEEIQQGLYTPEDALAREGETPRDTAVTESPRPEARPEGLSADAAATPETAPFASLAGVEGMPSPEAFQARMAEGFSSEAEVAQYLRDNGLLSGELGRVGLGPDGSLFTAEAAEGSFITHPAVDGQLRYFEQRSDGSLLSAEATEEASFTHPAVDGQLSALSLRENGSISFADAAEGSHLTYPGVDGKLETVRQYTNGNLALARAAEGSHILHTAVGGKLDAFSLFGNGSLSTAIPAEGSAVEYNGVLYERLSLNSDGTVTVDGRSVVAETASAAEAATPETAPFASLAGVEGVPTMEAFQARMVEGFSSEAEVAQYLRDNGLLSGELGRVGLGPDGSLFTAEAAEGSFITHPAVDGQLRYFEQRSDGSLLLARAAEGSSITLSSVEGQIETVRFSLDGSLGLVRAVEGSSITHPDVNGELDEIRMNANGSIGSAFAAEGSSFTHPAVDGQLSVIGLDNNGSLQAAFAAEGSAVEYNGVMYDRLFLRSDGTVDDYSSIVAEPAAAEAETPTTTEPATEANPGQPPMRDEASTNNTNQSEAIASLLQFNNNLTELEGNLQLAEDGVVEVVDADEIPLGTAEVQVGAFETRELAQTAWEQIEEKISTNNLDVELDNYARNIEEVTDRGRSFYRLRIVGFDDLTEARDLSSSMMSINSAAIPVIKR